MISPTVNRHIQSVAFELPVCGRARRIWLLLGALWVMNGFDLLFTLHAHQHGLLIESNPVAGAILPHGPVPLALFKIALVGFGSAIFAHYRRRRLVEGLTWVAAGTYVAVSFRWMMCYEIYQIIVAARYLPPVPVPV